MRPMLGAALVATTLAAGAIFAWRITLGVESWFATSGAGNVLMWSVVIALILTAFALPAAAWGMAARCWLVRLRPGEHLVSSAHTLMNEPATQDRYLIQANEQANIAPDGLLVYSSPKNQ